MGNQIPERSRRLVEQRQGGLCARCGGRGVEWHHRRSRSVRGPHRHCPCNGVLLCSGCHTWAHGHPTEAQEAGLIVSRYDEPQERPIKTLGGWFSLDCEGGGEHIVYVTHK